MTFTSAAAIALLALFGAAIVVAAFNAKRLIAWENRLFTSLANRVQEYRESLEEEAVLLARAKSVPAPVAVVKPTAQRKGRAA